MPVASGSYAAAQGVVARAVGDEMVLLNLGSGTYFSLNAVGAAIWDSIGRGEQLDAIVAGIVDAFEVDAATALADALDFLQDGIAQGLITEG